MDSENENCCDYELELEFCVQLITALEYVLQVLDDRPVRYPAFMADTVCLIQGRVARLADGEKVLVNGLEEQVQELYETMERLELEVQYLDGGESDGPDAQGMV